MAPNISADVWRLYEELLIGDNPKGANHPRIMTATEVSLSLDELQELLTRLRAACLAFDIGALRVIFLEAPLGYQPNDAKIHDLMWGALLKQGRAPTLNPPLQIVAQRG